MIFSILVIIVWLYPVPLAWKIILTALAAIHIFVELIVHYKE